MELEKEHTRYSETNFNDAQIVILIVIYHEHALTRDVPDLCKLLVCPSTG